MALELTTRLDAATERVREEHCAVVAEEDALDAFSGRVDDLVTAGGNRPVADGGVRTGMTGAGSCLATAGSGGPDERTAVREAFVDLVVPVVPDHVEDGSPATVLQDELGPEVAGALAGGGPLTPPLRAAIQESVAERRRELDATAVVLDREREQLAGARETVTTAVEWLRAADETPLSALVFDALRERHERLAHFRGHCDSLASERQAFLRGTTGRDGCRVTHEPFFEYLYGETDSPSAEYPVLAALAELATVCTDCQRPVRRHLTSRG